MEDDGNWSDLRRSTVIAEDDAVLAINKPVGISVMGERHETDIVRLAGDAGETLYPVHRIDKVTSGLVLFAKDLAVHGGLTRQFNKQTAEKAYLLITATVGLPPEGVIDLPLSAGRKGTVRIAAPRDRIRRDSQGSGAGRWSVASEDLLDTRMYPSVTRFATLWSDDAYSVILAEPVTGRRHQIRVHFAWIGHQILGDPLFDKAAAASGTRTCLHSFRLSLDAAWRDGERTDWEASPGVDFWAPLGDRLSVEAANSLINRAVRTRRAT